MTEIYDLNAFRRKKEGKKNKNEKLEEMDVEILARVLNLDKDKLKVLMDIKRSGFRMNSTTQSTAEKHFEDWTGDELADFINNKSILDLKSKPTFFIVALKKLKGQLLKDIE